MNHLLFNAALLLSVISGFTQTNSVRGEFATNLNGLMYSDNDMRSLRFIVDSLNLRFKACDLDKVYYSYPQTTVYHVSFRSADNNLKEIIRQIDNKVSFDQIVSGFSSYISLVDTGELFIRSGTRPNGEGFYYLQGSPYGGYDEIYWDKKYNVADKNLDNEWVYDYSPKDSYTQEYTLSCRYFPGELKRQAIPGKYARLIQYVDCMIDTSSTIFLTERYWGGWYNKDKKPDYYNLKEIADYLDEKMSVENKNNKRLKQLTDSQVAFVLHELKDDTLFRNLLAKTIDDYLKNEMPDHQLEKLALDLNMYDKALQVKRSYRIMGSCSQDTRPREHARDIAILAAQAHSWDIFLRAHLDIMNDRFERVSDGSYAWGERKTYLKELEELNLNIVDLMLGLTLRAENVADNHYYGTIWRLGWALTESKEKKIFEEKAIEMMKNSALDEFNRGLVFLLYKTYLGYLDETEAGEKRRILKETATGFPLFIQTSIQKMDEPKKRRRR